MKKGSMRVRRWQYAFQYFFFIFQLDPFHFRNGNTKNLSRSLVRRARTAVLRIHAKGRRQGKRTIDSTQSSPCIPYCPQILRLGKKSRGLDFHRHTRTDQGSRYLPRYTRRSLCHLRSKMYSKCYPIITDFYRASDTCYYRP